MPKSLSILVPCKNRSLIYEGGRVLMLFPNMVSSLRRATLVKGEARVVEMVVADFGSDDWPLEKWLPHYMYPFRVRIIQVDGPFSVGKAWNVAAEHARADRFWFLDTDMLVRRPVMSRGIACLVRGMAYFPICWSWSTPDHSGPGEWRRYGCGNVFMTRKHWERFGPRKEFVTHGKSDEMLLAEFQKAGLAVRERDPDFWHQWHPNTLGWLNRYYAGEYDRAAEAAKARG